MDTSISPHRTLTPIPSACCDYEMLTAQDQGPGCIGEEVAIFPGRLDPRQAITEWLGYNYCDLSDLVDIAIVGEDLETGDLRQRPRLSSYRMLRQAIKRTRYGLWVHHHPECRVHETSLAEGPHWVEHPEGNPFTICRSVASRS